MSRRSPARRRTPPGRRPPARRRSPARRRPPVRRSPARRSGRRSPRRDDALGFAGLAVLGLFLLLALLRWLAAHWWLPAGLALVGVAVGAVVLRRRAERVRWERVRQRALRLELGTLDALGHREFEYAVRDLLLRDGCADARQVGGANDRGADVLATDPYGRKWLVQCKHRRDGAAGSAVGTPDLQRVNGTARQLHGADVVLVVTNGRFSGKCPELARDLHMHLVGRELLGTWASGARPLWELLPRVPAPRRAS
ncbi:restriction endonuclease [Streptomyces sp. NPDC088923]|uniref:restriction endonuclease n=1 Tax=Streptomyces sp. NPDC088923 TaxID=3365913 RepID=UPI0038139725